MLWMMGITWICGSKNYFMTKVQTGEIREWLTARGKPASLAQALNVKEQCHIRLDKLGGLKWSNRQGQ